MAKRVLLVAEGVVGRAIEAVITLFGAEIVLEAEKADIVVAHTRQEVIKAIEGTALPIWQVAFDEPVKNRRVTVFDILDGFPKMLKEFAGEDEAPKA